LRVTLRVTLGISLGIALGIVLGVTLGIVGRLRLLCGTLVFRIGYRTPVHGLFLRVRTCGVLPDGLPGPEPLGWTLLSLWRTPLWVLPRRVHWLGVLRFGGLRLGGLLGRGGRLAGRFRGLPPIMGLLADRSALLAACARAVVRDPFAPSPRARASTGPRAPDGRRRTRPPVRRWSDAGGRAARRAAMRGPGSRARLVPASCAPVGAVHSLAPAYCGRSPARSPVRGRPTR